MFDRFFNHAVYGKSKSCCDEMKNIKLKKKYIYIHKSTTWFYSICNRKSTREIFGKEISQVFIYFFWDATKGFWCKDGKELIFLIGKILIDKAVDKDAKQYLVKII